MKEWKGTIGEGQQFVDLSELVEGQWNVGVADTVRASELIMAAQAMQVSTDALFVGIAAADRVRGIEEGHEGVLKSGLVPVENVDRVHDLLDEIQDLCVRM